MQKYPSIEPLKVGIEAIQQTMQQQRQWKKLLTRCLMDILCQRIQISYKQP